MSAEVTILILVSCLICLQATNSSFPTSTPSYAPTRNQSLKDRNSKEVRLGVGVAVAGAFGVFLLYGFYRRLRSSQEDENENESNIVFKNPSKVYVLDEAVNEEKSNM